MKQTYKIEIEGEDLPNDLSKDLAQEINMECLIGINIKKINISKIHQSK
jgi:hypothetical protein